MQSMPVVPTRLFAILALSSITLATSVFAEPPKAKEKEPPMAICQSPINPGKFPPSFKDYDKSDRNDRETASMQFQVVIGQKKWTGWVKNNQPAVEIELAVNQKTASSSSSSPGGGTRKLEKLIVKAPKHTVGDYFWVFNGVKPKESLQRRVLAEIEEITGSTLENDGSVKMIGFKVAPGELELYEAAGPPKKKIVLPEK